MFGADWCAPAITPPESCVLAFGAIKEKAASLNREIVSRDMMSLTASFDCREIDAESGARFLAEVKKLLESPELFVLAMAM
jgi:pyruvate dehydrogenase E2 component (dihydrolipoamide acetyltransferase)